MHDIDERAGGGLSEAAMTGNAQQVGEFSQVFSVVFCSCIFQNIIERASYDLGARAAGGAKPTALVREKMGKIAQYIQGVALLGKDHEAAATGDVRKVDRRVKLFRE